MPMQARIADKLALVRTVQFVEPMQQQLEEVYSGFPKASARPSFGSVISRFRGAASNIRATSARVQTGTSSYESPQYLARPSAIANFRHLRLQNLSLPMASHRTAAGPPNALACLRRDRRALDVRRESQDMDGTRPCVRHHRCRRRETRRSDARIGSACAIGYVRRTSVTSMSARSEFALGRAEVSARRRLVEAGVPVVTLRAGGWTIMERRHVARRHHLHQPAPALPLLDQSIHALVTDCTSAGWTRSVGAGVGRIRPYATDFAEWGATTGGRELALFAAPSATGQVVGETDSRGERPRTRAVGPQNVLGTVYHALGIEPTIAIPDSPSSAANLDDGRAYSRVVL